MHPRTASQGFRGKANWDLIAELKQRLSIPVIGNGDINSAEDGWQMIMQTKCDAVMVGRAAMANPFILSQIDDLINSGSYKRPSNYEIFRAMERLTQMYVNYFGEKPACKMLRSRLTWFVKGLPGCSSFRKNLSLMNSKSHALELIKEFEDSLT